jgi:MFS family permease
MPLIMQDAPYSPAGSRLSAASWRVLVLLGFSIFINYVDRGNLSIAAPLIKNELKLSPSELGILLSSFLWLYTLVQLPVGWLIDRFNVNWILAIGFFRLVGSDERHRVGPRFCCALGGAASTRNCRIGRVSSLWENICS